MTYSNLIREEELKNKIASDFFSSYDTTQILGDVDFSVALSSGTNQSEKQYFLWAEAKKGDKSYLDESISQLILTIGKARTFEHHLPPAFVGAFDSAKIGFVPYNSVHEVFYMNDFNWNVPPSDHTTKEFLLVLDFVRKSLSDSLLTFSLDRDKKELEKFIKSNFKVGKKNISRIKISKNNFVVIYQKWLKEVCPSIMVDWDVAKSKGVFDSDFYLADLLSEEDISIKEKLQVLLEKTHYTLGRRRNELGLFTSSRADFNDGQKAYKRFWCRYDRPPRKEYWDYIINRKDLLVSQDIRERQGSFFTPQKWVELSQQYLASELGDDWQDQYYIWDCAAGTGNLLNGLTNKYRIWASTLNQADVDVMHERIENGANLLHSHVFQFDFLNDSFDKLPASLREIVNSEDGRRRLVVYINPPYAEAATTRQKTGTGSNKKNVSLNQTAIRYRTLLGGAVNELYAQFMIRVHQEIPSSVLANFSKLKNLQAPNFRNFRKHFRAKLGRIFLVPANSFDNVKGEFPIGFHVWHLDVKESFTGIEADVYDKGGSYAGTKSLNAPVEGGLIMDWLKTFHDKSGRRIAYLRMLGSDIQNDNGVFITNTPSESDLKQRKTCDVTVNNLESISVYFSVRQVIKATWLNDRDQYTFPGPEWMRDDEFKNNCLIYSIFSSQNRINREGGINHWIPFTEYEVGAPDNYESHFMIDYISGKGLPGEAADLFSAASHTPRPLIFSAEAEAVLDAGRALWSYYHSQHSDSDPNASLYDIKLYFQGTKITNKGKEQMRGYSDDEKYTTLIQELRARLCALASRIEPKVYEYGFLKP